MMQLATTSPSAGCCKRRPAQCMRRTRAGTYIDLFPQVQLVQPPALLLPGSRVERQWRGAWLLAAAVAALGVTCLARPRHFGPIMCVTLSYCNSLHAPNEALSNHDHESRSLLRSASPACLRLFGPIMCAAAIHLCSNMVVQGRLLGRVMCSLIIDLPRQACPGMRLPLMKGPAVRELWHCIFTSSHVSQTRGWYAQ